jgi:hypothetical protein
MLLPAIAFTLDISNSANNVFLRSASSNIGHVNLHSSLWMGNIGK